MKKILLTSAGLSKSLENLVLKQIAKRASEIKVIFIPSAATHTDGAREGLAMCMSGLQNIGILSDNIFIYNLQYLLSKNYSRTYSSQIKNISPSFRLLTVKEMNEYDILIFCGGESSILLNEVNRTGFDDIIKQSVENGLFYIGVSAGSMIAAGNLPNTLGFIKNTLSVHCEVGMPCGDLPHNKEINLSDTQAIWIYDNYAQIIE